MLQPFERFIPAYIDRLTQLQKTFLVTQSYNVSADHFSDNQLTGILLTDYDDIGLARIHYAAVKNDRYASVIDLHKPAHKNKLAEMLKEGSKYALYWSVVKSAEDIKKRLDLGYKPHIQRWITKNTDWRIGADESIKPQVQVIFGELFVTLKRGRNEIRVKFTDIERS